MAADGRMPYSGQRPPRWGNWGPARRARWKRNNLAPNPALTRGPDQTRVPGAYPGPNFMPHMPAYEAGLRGLEDQYSYGMKQLQNQWNLVEPQAGLQTARLATNQGFDTERLKEQLAERQILAGEGQMSGVYNQLFNRDIEIPYGRAGQDISQWAGEQYSNLSSQMGELGLGYNQGMLELILSNAADAAANLPMNVPFFGQGGKSARRPLRR